MTVPETGVVPCNTVMEDVVTEDASIFSLNIFTEPMVIFPPQVFGGQMGPQDSALFYVLYLFDQAFTQFRMGYASALAWVLFVISLVIVTIQLRGSRRLVYTETNDQ